MNPLVFRALLGAVPAQGPEDPSWQREPWQCQPPPWFCQLILNCSHPSPTPQAAHAAPLSISEEPEAVSSLPSPELLKELLQQSQRKQRMGQGWIRGSKVMQTNTSLLKSNILPPANKTTKWERSACPRPHS